MAQLVLSNRLEEVARMTAWLHGAGKEFALPDEILGDLDLALNELVVNVISYGYPQGGEGAIELTLEVVENRIRVKLVDDGIPFDPLSRQAPEAPASLAEAPLGGLGIGLALGVTESPSYERSEERNRLVLFSRAWE